MAINNITISQFAEIPFSNITDNTVTPVESDGSNYKLSMASIKRYSEFKLTDMPSITSSELSQTSEFVVNELEQSKITLEEIMEYVRDNIPTLDRGSLRLSTTSTQTITDDAEPVTLNCFNQAVTQQGALIPNQISNNITYIGDGASTAIVTLGINVEFAGNEELELYLYINETKYSDTPIKVRGAGVGVPTIEFWQSDISLSPNDVLTLRGRNGAVGSFVLTYLRTTFRVDI